jgi:NADPH-dependent glutamate synthase beta subunit-like oxidoreductase/ferredoxin
MAPPDSAGATGAVNETGLRVTLPGLDYYREQIACQAACPVDTDVRGMVTAIARGEYQAAWDMARQVNPFAAVCGSACSAPCEKACRRGHVDSPVAAASLQRFVAETAGPTARPLDLTAPERAPENSRTAYSVYALSQYGRDYADQRRVGANVAVIGSGPAGLTAAHDLALLGHAVDIYEASDRAGGMMLRGIPEFVLPRAVIEAEVSAILEMPGVQIEFGMRLGDELILAELAERYDGVVLALGDPGQWYRGAGGSIVSVSELVERLRVGRSSEVGRQVVIVGGCNRSIYAARAAARIQRASDGPVKVTMVTHRIVGSVESAREAQREGVEIISGYLPSEVSEEDGQVSVPLGPGRGMLVADLVVLPMGDPQLEAPPTPDLSRLPGNVIAAQSPHADDGVIYAVASGHRAAAEVESLIQGKTLGVRRSGRMHPIEHSDFEVPGSLTALAQEPEMIPPARRGPFDVVDLGFTAAEAQAEARRCLKCNVNTVFESPRCITCGDCVDVCPPGCLLLTGPENASGPGLDSLLAQEFGAGLDFQRNPETSSEATLILKDDSMCANCGLCVQICPTDVISFEWFGFSETLDLIKVPA